jgi:hypothetical protein
LEFDERAKVDGVSRREFAQRQLLKLDDGLLDLRGLARLAPGEIRCFETARIVFIFGFALFVSGFGMGGAGRFEIQIELADQMINNLLDEM